MAGWTEEDFNNWYSPVKARVPRDHPLFGQSFAYGWNYFAYGSRRAIDGATEELGYLDNYNWVTNLVSRNIYTPGNKTLIVGCGIGATVYRVLEDYPNASIWGTDTSDYIHQLKDIGTPAGFDTNLILNVDITSPTAKNDLKNGGVGGNGSVGVVICEMVTETIPLAELTAWFLACDNLLSNNGIVVHIVMSNKDGLPVPDLWSQAGWNWLSVDEWGSLAPNHYFIDSEDTSIAYTSGGA